MDFALLNRGKCSLMASLEGYPSFVDALITKVTVVIPADMYMCLQLAASTHVYVCACVCMREHDMARA